MQIDKYNHDYSEEWFSTAEYTEQDIRELILENEHFYEDLLYTVSLDYQYKISCLPVRGLRHPVDKILFPPKVYNYNPDERLQTLKLLGKDSPGLPPPICF